jgi:alginate O-acetyltransferase complex protein AlgI
LNDWTDLKLIFTLIDFTKIIDLLKYQKEAPLLFSSGLFLFIFLGFYGIYLLTLKNERLRILWVTAFSLYFYYKCAGIYWLLHVLIVMVDFTLAIFMEKAKTKQRKYALLGLSLLVNLGMLIYFKYTNYFLEIYSNVTHGTYTAWDIFLPAGISFFTFQSLSYTIDVYRGELKALRNILDYAFFVTFFPQMLAGPIVRAADFLPQINKIPSLNQAQFGRAVFLICTGLFKKAVISDYISANFVDRVFESPNLFTGLENLSAIYGYAIQIYCDFSGYSDMAIGLALLMGFTFPINFNAPYQSLSITEFWRRWHISLSTWLRDYLYVPLGGNRKGTFKTYRNLLITMILGGLWHGAATRFLIWGTLHGLVLAMERFFKSLSNSKSDEVTQSRPVTTFLKWFFTFHFVCFCWIFFRAQDLNSVWEMLHQIAFSFQPQVFWDFIKGYSSVLCFILLGFALHFVPNKFENRVLDWTTRMPLIGKAILITLIALLVMQTKSSEVQPFIYFQF